MFDVLRAARLRLAVSTARAGDLAADRSGSIAIPFALTTLIVMALVGAAVDYSRSIGTEQKLQSAVDQAMLAAVRAPAGSQTTVATTMLNAALAGSGITATWSSPPAVDANGNLKGTATGTISTTIMGMLGIRNVSTSASATVKPPAGVPSNLVFTLTGAYGWYWKEVDLYIHQPGASSNTLLASYIYQPVNLGYSSGRGNGTASAQFLTAGVMVSNAVTTPVVLGSTYDTVYLQMTVYSDGCGPGMAPTTSQSSSTTNYNCVTSGSKVQTGTSHGQPVYTTYTKTATPVLYSTNDPSTAHNLFIGNPEVDLPNNQVPSIFTLLPCGQTIQHAWEDTAWANPLPSSWSQQDIFFNVQTVTCALNANYQSMPLLVH